MSHFARVVVAAAFVALPMAVAVPAAAVPPVAVSTSASQTCATMGDCLLDRPWQLDPAATTVDAVAKHGVLRLTLRGHEATGVFSASMDDGCNGLGANLALDRERHVMTFEHVHSTPRYCDEVSNAAENALARALSNAAVGYRVTGSTLVLHTQLGDLAFQG